MSDLRRLGETVGSNVSFLAVAIYLPVSIFFKQGLSVSFALLGIAGLLALQYARSFVKTGLSLFLLLSIFPLANIGMVVLGAAPGYTFWPATKFIGVIGASYFAFVRVKDLPFRIEPVITGIILSLLLVVLNIVTDFYIPKALGREKDFVKWMGHFSLFLGLSSCLVVYELLNTQELKRKLMLLAVLLGAVFTVFTLENHTARHCVLLGPIIGLTVWAMPRAVVRNLLSVVVTVVVLGMPWILKCGLDIQTTAKTLSISRGSFYHRLVIWHFLADQILKDPLKARGFDVMRHTDYKQKKKEWDEGKKRILLSEEIQKKNRFATPHHPHNAALQVWQEFGVVGALVLSCFLLYAIYLINLFPTRLGRATGYALFTMACVYFHVSYGLWESKWWMILVIIFGMLVNLENKAALKRQLESFD